MGIFQKYFPIGLVNTKHSNWSDDSSSHPVGKKFVTPPQTLLSFLVVLLAGLILFKAFNLQVVNSQKSALISEENRIRITSLPAPRGIIFDSKQTPLVRNVPRYQLRIIGANLPNSYDRRQQALEKIKAVSGAPIPNEENILSAKILSPEPIVILDNIDRERALKMQLELSGVAGAQITYLPARRYSSEAGLSHILGYVSKINPKELEKFPDYRYDDTIGKQGLEKSYETYLKGKDGAIQTEVDSLGRLQRVIAKQPPVAGANLELSLDLGLQKVAYRALREKAQEVRSNAASAIAINPQTGLIYALVSLPAYDNNLFIKPKREDIKALLSDASKPMVNRAISGVYPPGSIIKPLVAAGALEEGIVSENFRIDTPAEIKIGEFVFRDWKDHGLTDIKRAIAESNNVFFYSLGGGWGKIRGLGAPKLASYLKMFGLGKETGIDLSPESKGLVPEANWKRKAKNEPWYIGDTYHLAIGQGDITLTPIQIIRAISVIANGGNLIKPQLVKKILSQDGKELFKFKTQITDKLPISSQNLRVVREGLEQAFEYGSARFLQGVKDKNGNFVKMAGKTGTAQFGAEGKTHAWFVSYAPAQNPQIAVVVLVEGGGGGHNVALPVAKKIYDYWFTNHES